MALMGIRLSLLGGPVLCLDVLYHLYLGFLASYFTSFVMGAPAVPGGNGGLMNLHKLLATLVVGRPAAGPRCIRCTMGICSMHRPRAKPMRGLR